MGASLRFRCLPGSGATELAPFHRRFTPLPAAFKQSWTACLKRCQSQYRARRVRAKSNAVMDFNLPVAAHPGRSLMLQAFTGVSKVERRKEIAVKHLLRKIRTTKPKNKSPTKIEKVKKVSSEKSS
jgi:hypothetical protein